MKGTTVSRPTGTRENAGSAVELVRSIRFVRLGVRAAAFVAIGGAIWMVARISGIIAPLVIAMLGAIVLAALLMPLQLLFNHRLRLPRYLASAATVVVFLGVLTGLFWLVVDHLTAELEDLRLSVLTELDRVEDWLADQLPFASETIRDAMDQVEEWVIGNQGAIFGGALTVGTSAVTILLGAVIALLGTFFLLAQGDRVWAWFIDLLNEQRARRLHEAGRRGWVTLSTYIKMQVLIAAIDAIAIGIGAFFLGLPFLLPLVLITFVLCIIPFIGAFVSGALFVLVALFTDGLSAALIMLLIVVAVQQLESDLLSPFLMGQAVNLHPLALLVGATAGVYLVGLGGALFVVPVLAVGNTVRLYLSGDDMFPQLDRGGSALTGSAKKLSRGRVTPKLPKRVGHALPEVARKSRAAESHSDEQDPEQDVPAGTHRRSADEGDERRAEADPSTTRRR